MTITDIANTANLARSTVARVYRTQNAGKIRAATHLAVLSIELPPRRPRTASRLPASTRPKTVSTQVSG